MCVGLSIRIKWKERVGMELQIDSCVESRDKSGVWGARVSEGRVALKIISASTENCGAKVTLKAPNSLEMMTS